MQTRAAPTENMEYGRRAKPAITATLNSHFTIIQPCLANPHDLTTP